MINHFKLTSVNSSSEKIKGGLEKSLSSLLYNIETKLHFAYTSKNMTDNATGKNWMSKTFSLQNFLSDSRQLWVYIITKWRKSIWKKKEMEQLTCLNL